MYNTFYIQAILTVYQQKKSANYYQLEKKIAKIYSKLEEFN